MWKTLSARIRGSSTELQELNEEEDQFTKTTSKLRDLVKSLTGFDIMKDKDTFKSIYDIILGIGEEWDNLTDIEQASLAEALAGKRNSNALLATLGNLDTLQGAYKKAEESAGSAAREQENYTRSLQYSIDRTKASLEELAYDVLDSDWLKNGIEGVNSFIVTLDSLVEHLNPLTALLTITGGVGIKGFIENFSNLVRVGEFTQLVNSFKGMEGNAQAINQVGSALLGLDKAQQMTLLSSTAFSNAQKIQALETAGLSTAEARLQVQTYSLAMAQQTANDSTGNLTKAFKGLGSTIKGIGSGLLKFLSSPLGILTAVAIGLAAFEHLLTKIDRDGEKARKSIADAVEGYEDEKNKLEQLNSELETISERIDELNSKETLTITEQEELENLQKQNKELERQIELQERLLRVSNQNIINDYRKNEDKLQKDFSGDYNSFINLQQSILDYENERDKAVASLGAETYEENLQELQENLEDERNAILDTVNTYVSVRETLLSKWNNDYSQMGLVDKRTFDQITENLNKAYKAVYSDAEFEKEVINPIFSSDNLKAIRNKMIGAISDNKGADGLDWSKILGDADWKSLNVELQKYGVDIDKVTGSMQNNVKEIDLIKGRFEEVNRVIGFSNEKFKEMSKGYTYDQWLELSEHVHEYMNAILGTEDAVESMIPSFEEAKESVLGFINGTEDATSELQDLQTALADTRNMSAETYATLISHSQKYANTISIENGRLVVNRDRLYSVAESRVKEQKETLKQVSNLKKLEYLKHYRELKMYDDKIIDTTSDTYQNALALQDQITQLDLLSNQLDIASDSFERFKEAQSTENAPDYDTGMNAFTTITEGLSSSKVGTDDFKYAMQALMSVDQYKEFAALAKEGYDAQYDFIEKWQKQNAKFFTDDDRANAIAWQEYLIETGLLQDGMIASSEELGKATGFSYDIVNALNENLNQYDFDGKIVSQYQIDYIDEANEALTNLTNAQQAYKNAVEQGTDENLITSLKEDLEKAQVDYDEFIAGIPEKVKEAKQSIAEDDTNLLDVLFGENETDASAFTEVLGMQIENLTKKAKEFEATNEEGVLNSDAYKKVIEDLKTYQSIYNEIIHANYQRMMSNTTQEDSEKQSRMLDNIREQQNRLETLKQGLVEASIHGDKNAIEHYKEQIAAVEYSLAELENNQIFIDIQLKKDVIDSEINALKNELDELQKSAPVIDLSSSSAGAYQAQNAFQSEVNKKKASIDKLEKQKMELDTTINYVVHAEEAEKKRKELEQDIDTDVNVDIKDEDMQKVKLLHDLLDDIKNMGAIQVGVNVDTSGTGSLLQDGAKINYIPNGAPSGILGRVNGTAHADGDWALSQNENKALVGELGPEGLVRDGKFYLIGKKGPERRNLKKGDIIFNHKQVEEILDNKSATGRGTLIGDGHALGTILGNAFANANNKLDPIKIRGGSGDTVSKEIGKAADKAKDEIDETEKETEEATDNFIDWIERRINHVTTIAERKLKSTEKLLDRVTNTLYSGGKNGVKAYKTFDKTVNSFYKSATESQKAVMEVQSQAYEAYENLSNAVGLDAEYQKRVKEGIMEIENVTDEALSKQIQQYQDYYDKSQTALDAFIDAADKFYHMPIDKAAEKIENLNNKIEYLDKVSTNRIGFRQQNAVIAEQATQQKEILRADRQAKNKTEKNRDKAAKSLNSIVLKETKADLKSTQKKLKQEKKDVKAKKTLATASKKAQNEIKKATKANEKIDTKQLKKGTKAYKEAVQYNKALKANDVAKTSNKTVKRAVRDKQAINPDDVPNVSKKATQSIYAYNSAVASATEAWNEFKNKKEEVDHLLNVEYPKQAFDNVINSWEHVISAYDSDITDLQNQINQLTTLSKKVGTGFYKAQKEIDQNKLAGLKQDRIDAEKALAELDKNGRYSDEWFEARDTLKQIDAQISELTIDIYNMNKAIVQAHSDAVKAMNEDIDWLSSEVDLFKELQSFYENTDEKTGWYTSQGLNNMALLKAQRDMRSEQLKNTQTYYKTLKDMMDKGILDNGELVFNSFEELTAAAEEAQKEQANYVKEVNASDDALAKAVIEQLQAELKFMQNISDEKKKALQSEKDLYEYQKKILDKTKNIAKLERQIAAYSGDSSEEGRAKRQRLQGQLNEAQEDLRDTEYDRYISDQTQMLDDMMKEYGDRVEELSKNRDWLLEQANNIATASKDIALQSLTQLANANGYIPIEMQNLSDAVLQNGTNTTTAISGYLGEGSPLYSMIQANNAAEVTNSSDALNSIKNILGQSGTTSIQDYLKIISENTAPTEIAQEMIETTAVPAMEVASDILSLGGLLDVSGSSGKKSSTKKSSSKKSSTKKSTTKTTTTKKTTTKKKKKNGAADGGIVEALNRMVFDNGDDGIATVRVGEAILTPTDSKNLASLADKFQTIDVSADILNALKSPDNRNFGTSAQNIDYGGVQFNFELPNVVDSSTLIRAIQDDSKLQKAIQSVSVDRLNGGGRLSVRSIK